MTPYRLTWDDLLMGLCVLAAAAIVVVWLWEIDTSVLP